MCTDIDAARIAQLKAGGVPIYEEHLEEVLASARNAGRISYKSDTGEAIRFGDAIFICVGTPPREDGSADLSAIDHVAQKIAAEAQSSKLVVEKSTVPARTGVELRRALAAYSEAATFRSALFRIRNFCAKERRFLIFFIRTASWLAWTSILPEKRCGRYTGRFLSTNFIAQYTRALAHPSRKRSFWLRRSTARSLSSMHPIRFLALKISMQT